MSELKRLSQILNAILLQVNRFFVFAAWSAVFVLHADVLKQEGRIKNTVDIDVCMYVCVFTRKEELAAVTVPWGLMKAGFSLAICSMEDGRMPLSLETMSRSGKDKNIYNMSLNNFIFYDPLICNVMYFSLKDEAVFTWHFEGDDILQQTIILGLFGESVWPQSELILLHSGDSKRSSQTISAVAHRFSCGELRHSRKLHMQCKGYRR